MRWHWEKNSDLSKNYLGQIEVILINLDIAQDWLCNEYESIEFGNKWYVS